MLTTPDSKLTAGDAIMSLIASPIWPLNAVVIGFIELSRRADKVIWQRKEGSK